MYQQVIIQMMKTVNSKEEIIMGKVVFLDVDGTLCDYDGVIPESAKQAIGQGAGTDTRSISAPDVRVQKSIRKSGTSDLTG